MPSSSILLQLGQTVDAAANGAEVGEHAAQPSGVDIVRAGTLGFVTDGFLRLLLGADKQD